MHPDEYEIGYKRPPLQHRFQKGQPTRNPRGRPKGVRSPNLTQVLLEPVSLKLHGRVRKVPFAEAYLQVMKDKALRGDLKAGQILLSFMKELGFLAVEKFPEDWEITLNVSKPPGMLDKAPDLNGEGDEPK
jgi:hypothetical protein